MDLGQAIKNARHRQFPVGLLGLHLDPHHLTRATIGEHLEGVTADFAIGGESLGFRTGIHYQVEPLTAERALHSHADFNIHSENMGRLCLWRKAAYCLLGSIYAWQQ